MLAPISLCQPDAAGTLRFRQPRRDVVYQSRHRSNIRHARLDGRRHLGSTEHDTSQIGKRARRVRPPHAIRPASAEGAIEGLSEDQRAQDAKAPALHLTGGLEQDIEGQRRIRRQKFYVLVAQAVCQAVPAKPVADLSLAFPVSWCIGAGITTATTTGVIVTTGTTTTIIAITVTGTPGDFGRTRCT
jgi:hypothetical protein